jgi:hypothetical protein
MAFRSTAHRYRFFHYDDKQDHHGATSNSWWLVWRKNGCPGIDFFTQFHEHSHSASYSTFLQLSHCRTSSNPDVQGIRRGGSNPLYCHSASRVWDRPAKNARFSFSFTACINTVRRIFMLNNTRLLDSSGDRTYNSRHQGLLTCLQAATVILIWKGIQELTAAIVLPLRTITNFKHLYSTS